MLKSILQAPLALNFSVTQINVSEPLLTYLQKESVTVPTEHKRICSTPGACLILSLEYSIVKSEQMIGQPGLQS